MNERKRKPSCDPVVPYVADPYSALDGIHGALADARPFVAGLLSPAEADYLVSMPAGQPRRWKRLCPFCKPDVAYVTIERETAGAWRITHPLPYCPEFSRFDQAG